MRDQGACARAVETKTRGSRERLALEGLWGLSEVQTPSCW